MVIKVIKYLYQYPDGDVSHVAQAHRLRRDLCCYSFSSHLATGFMAALQ